MSFLSSLIMCVIVLGCSSWSREQKVVDRAIEAHGGKQYREVQISFDFRDKHYIILKTADRFEYTREFKDSTGLVLDVLNNKGFTRTINGEEISLTDEWRKAYSNSVNSVAYFMFLPYGLNDPAVIKEWKGETEIDGQAYDVLKVSFLEEGGGEDFEDEFIYWFNRESGLMDYLAYSYHTDGGGVRFRKAINSRIVNGIRIQDYENYKPKDKEVPLDAMEELFKHNALELLSEIINENVQVKFQDQ